MSDTPAPEFNAEADNLLAGVGLGGEGSLPAVVTPAPEAAAPNAGAGPDGQTGGNAPPGGQTVPEAPAPAPLLPSAPAVEPAPAAAPATAEPVAPATPVTPDIRVGKSVRLIPTDAVDVRASEIKKANPGMSFHEAVDTAREQLGIRPAAPAAAPAAPVASPAAPAPAAPVAETAPALARMEAIAVELGSLNPIIDAAEIQTLQIEHMRLQGQAVREQAQLQMQQLMQEQASLTAEQAEAQRAIDLSWQTAATAFPTLAQESSPLRESFDDRMEELRQSTNPADLAILEHPDCEFIVASQCAARMGASAFAPAVAAPGGPQAPVTGSPAPQTLQPAATPRPVLPVVPGSTGGDHTQQAGLRPADPNADLQTRLAAARTPMDEADLLMDSISGGQGPRSNAPFFMS